MNKAPKNGPRLALLWYYLLAVLISYILATVFSTQSVIFNLSELDVPVSLGQRLSMTMHDLTGMAGILLPVIAAGLGIAFPIAGFLGRRSPQRRTALYILAGALALLTIHFSMKAAFGVIFIAGARTALGLASQALAGALGGYAFASWSHSRG